ncbi:hypothetical protein P7H22_16325 [Paenibacillus larvae]|nr:hypothetical protein [Paenibacillus larvae]MDT2241602.1 hypothetical protein [Paenibacillus larvae]
MGTDSRTEENKQPMLDTDDDGICIVGGKSTDIMLKNNIAVFSLALKGSKEEEELIKQGFKKFVSNPNESHTAGIPIRI